MREFDTSIWQMYPPIILNDPKRLGYYIFINIKSYQFSKVFYKVAPYTNLVDVFPTL